jgi:transcriptional regulator with XRE-family HTH domain
MTNTNKLLDKFKVVCLAPSDNAAAIKLGLTRATISGWRHGKSHANAEAVERMCEGAGEPLAKWLPLIEAERARTAGDRRVWLRLAQGAASIGLLALALQHRAKSGFGRGSGGRIELTYPNASNNQRAPTMHPDQRRIRPWCIRQGMRP